MKLEMRPSRSIMRSVERRLPRLLMMPAIIVLVAVVLVPFGVMFWYSFTDFSFTLPGHEGAFVGIENYRRALTSDDRLWSSALTTALFVTLALPVEFVVGVIVAVALHRSPRHQRIVVPLIALPALLAPVTTGVIWRLLLHGDYGLVSYMAQSIGLLEQRSVLSDPNLAFGAIVAIDIVQWTPFFAIVILAGLKALPTLPYEAARVDGASNRFIFRTVTFPLLRPVIAMSILFRFMDCAKEFDKVFVLTRGGPASATELLSIYSYLVCFEHGQLGYGSAITLLFFVIVLFGCNIVLRSIRAEI